MRTAASCWKSIWLLLWTLLDTSVKEWCSCYEIQVPGNYTALNGELEITIIGLRRKSSEEIRLELLEVEYVREEHELQKRSPIENELVDHNSLTKFVDTKNTTDFLDVPEDFLNRSGTKQIPRDKIKLESLSRVFDSNESQIPQIKVSKKWTILGSVIVPPTEGNESDVVKVKFPCGVITRGGQFGVRLTGMNQELNNLTRKHKSSKSSRTDTSFISEIGSNLSIVGLDVRWPPCVLSISPRHIETYTDVPVIALLQFLPTKCAPAVGAPIPETWLDLMSCGDSPSGCNGVNSTRKQVVYSEQIRGYPRRRQITLKCELFGMAGHFGLALRSSVQTGTYIETQNKDAFLKAVWSEQYIFNVHARSIFPCDAHGGGVPVLFQYPKCILKGDRVRLFSRLRAEVSSLAAPNTLHYVTEQRVLKGKYSLYFDCDLFTDKYIEYCFVYVSQAITGAVTDVREDCVPTIPVTDLDSGGWGAWSPWSACTLTCGGGTRIRYRACDSPPPRYGARFCEGPSYESERCGNTDWDCEFYQRYPSEPGYPLPADRPEIMAEVGPGCRCGCVIFLGEAKPRRLLATSSQSCPGRTIWVIQADREHIIRFSVEHFRFPCNSQWLKVRDGDSRSATLIGELSRSHTTSLPVTSSGPSLLIEFFSDESLASGQECGGGFVAHAQQSRPVYSNASSVSSGFSLSNILRNIEVAPTATSNLTLVHFAVALFVCTVIFVSGCLGIQYIYRYRKYHLAAAAEDTESMTGDSQGSLIAVRSRATSNSTLLSEVISLHKFKPSRIYKHSRLREEDNEMEEEETLSDTSQHDGENCATPTPSQNTLKAAIDSEGSIPSTASLPETPKASPNNLRRSITFIPEENTDKKTSYKVSKKSISNKLNPNCISPLLDDIGNSSSLDSNTSRSSSDVVRKIFQLRSQSISSSSTKSGSVITNGYDSPSSSLKSTGSRNPKAKKEKRNLEKLLAGSEFSLSGDADLELDYYDYNVHNASAVPESYIGMDPAYLIWVPPFSPVSWDGENDSSDADEKDKPEIRDSNIDEELTKTPRKETVVVERQESGGKLNENVVKKGNNRGPSDKVTIGVRKNPPQLINRSSDRCRYLPVDREEKEIRVEKSPSGQSVYYEVIDDIKYADDDDEEIDNSKNDIFSSESVKKEDAHVKT